MTSNNSPLLKDSQELTKTKGTIWKPLIAVSSLSIFSFISGQYLPYVIIAVSGSGPIAAVPLAIFAVSTAVALISIIYLIRLAVSRADNKKEEPQKFVCENCTNLENEPTEKEFDKSVKQGSGSKTEVEDKSNAPTPQQPPLTLGTSIPQNNNAPLPPPPSVSAPPPPPPPPPPLSSGAVLPPPPGDNSSFRPSTSNNDHNQRVELLASIRDAGGKPKKAGQNSSGSAKSSIKGKEDNLFIEELERRQKGNAKNKTGEELTARIDRKLEERKKQNKQDLEIDPELRKKLHARSRCMGGGLDSSDDEHDSSANSPIVDGTSHNGETASETTPHGSQNTGQSHREVSGSVARDAITNVLLNKVNHLYPQSPNSQPDGERRSESPHSEYESDEDWDTDPEPIEQASSGS